MEPAVAFYQTLTSVSFTLLTIWFAVMQFAHGGWRTDGDRHRATLHIALHFFLPGMLGLSSLLSAPSDGGVIWRSAFVLAGAIGAVEAVQFLTAPEGPDGTVQRALRTLDPVLYVALVATAFVPAKATMLTPLQIGGMVNGAVFLSGLCSVWLAFAERPAAGSKDVEHPGATGQPGRGGEPV
jgi:hypothetical protein